MADRPALRTLADRRGIHAGYESMTGATVETADATRVALLAAMGVDAATEEAAARALDAAERTAAARLVAPTRVVPVAAGAERVTIAVPAAVGRARAWALALVLEDGTAHRSEGRADGGGAGRLDLVLPAPPPLGYHRLDVTVVGDAGERTEAQALIVVPPRCPLAAERCGGRRVFGLTVNLYTLRSARNWGIGNVGDLAALVDWCGAIGAAFVGVSPLHALRNAGAAISPYSPVSRLFRNPLYLDVGALPELADSPAARAMLADPALHAALARLRDGAQVAYAEIAAHAMPVLRALHGAFVARHRDRDTPRGRAYRAYRAEQGDALDDFATFLALDAARVAEGALPGAWRTWPAPYRDPRAPAVGAFRAAHAGEVDLHRWLQFALDAALAEVAARARARGLAIGLYQDLALGSAGDGSDPWAFPGLFVDGASVGAPPDDYAPTGQDWALPALDPARLAADGYRYWIRLVRNALAHAGALRIDHVLGVLRQYWIPAGRPGSEGAYVRFPADDLLGIVALEATRAGALVVGEDVGTVPHDFHRLLERWGVLSSRVLYFERVGDGEFRAASDYEPRALLTANTHDLAPLAGWWSGRDLDLRRATGLLPSDAALAEARARRARERRGLVRRLAADGALAAAGEAAVSDPPPAAAPAVLRGAVHRFLCATPAALVGIALDDLTGEVEPVNLPGVGLERYPSWSRRMRVAVEDLPRDPDVRTALAGTAARALRGGPRC